MLRQYFAASAWPRRFARSKHPMCPNSIRNSSTSSRFSGLSRSRSSFLWGVGVISVAAFCLYPHTIYADTVAKKVPRRIPPGLRAIDGAQTDTFGEDAMRVAYDSEMKSLCIGIFDGHNGSSMARELARSLPEIVLRALAILYQDKRTDVSSGRYISLSQDAGAQLPSEMIELFIRLTFVAYDYFALSTRAQNALGLDSASYKALQGLDSVNTNNPISIVPIRPPRIPKSAAPDIRSMYSGSCALLGLFNGNDRSLRVAQAGNSQAILGRRVPTNGGYKYEVHHLTPAKNAQKDFVVGKRHAHAFGDGAMKWSRAVQMRLHEEGFGDPPTDAGKTPILTSDAADPVMTTKDIKTGDFAVFASAGLWDCLTSEEVVGLVGQWLEEKGAKEYAIRIDSEFEEPHAVPVPVPSPFFILSRSGPTSTEIKEHQPTNSKIYIPSELPVVYPATYRDTTTMYKSWGSRKQFVCEDKSAAVHLMRNALGGANHAMASALLDMPMPQAKKFRDDISLYVVFFD